MHLLHSFKCAASALVALLLFASPAVAQFRGQVYVSGLTHPVAFVQDPANASVQFVVQKEGTIRVVQGGTLLSSPFLDLSDAVATGGERGLLSLAFPPGSAASGRFFVTFVNTDGHTVVSRFHRSADPLVADPSTRLDLKWSTGERFISHPEVYHYGGNLVFGADGYLYIGTGDGGEPNDASHHAQNLTKLHGKILRIDVSVADDDPEGLDIPADNPFVGGDNAPEIWAIGLRNPWRFSLDDPARGGTGGFIIADVGEDAVEELNYLPRRPGRAQLRLAESGRRRTTTKPRCRRRSSRSPIRSSSTTTASDDRSLEVSSTAAPAIPSMTGRYVFGDFVRGRIWSLAIATDPATGEATASDLREHTGEIGAGVSLRMISSFGIDAAGELYVVNYGDGTIIALKPAEAAAPIIRIDTPMNGASVRQPFVLSGWAIDASAATLGIATLHVWGFPIAGGDPRFLGVANHGDASREVASLYGAQFGSAGYHLTVAGLATGDWVIAVYGWVEATQSFSAVSWIIVSVQPGGLMVIDTPAPSADVPSSFLLGGWAVDLGAGAGTGVDTIHVWAFAADGSVPPRFVGVPQFVERPDVASYLGEQFRRAGYNMIVSGLGPGEWDLYVFAFSSVSNAFDNVKIVRVTVR